MLGHDKNYTKNVLQIADLILLENILESKHVFNAQKSICYKTMENHGKITILPNKNNFYNLEIVVKQ